MVFLIRKQNGQNSQTTLSDLHNFHINERYSVCSRSSGAQQQQSQQHHAFLFKKHLFLDQYINLSDPVEKELLYFQMLHSIRVDRFPITEMEAVNRLIPAFRVAH